MHELIRGLKQTLALGTRLEQRAVIRGSITIKLLFHENVKVKPPRKTTALWGFARHMLAQLSAAVVYLESLKG